MNDDTTQPLAAATATLRDTPIPDGPPADAVTRAQRIPANRRPLLLRLSPARIAAAIALVLVTLAAVLVLQHSTTTAFADVAQAVARTHTFTAALLIGDSPDGRMLVKDSLLRIEGPNAVAITNLKTGQSLYLTGHHAVATGTRQTAPLDFYALLSEHRAGTEQSLGERTIDGRKTQGFRLTRPDLPDASWAMWVDPKTRLPVRVEMPQGTLTDLQFDVPLDDALFSLAPPPGYSVDAEKTVQYTGQVNDPSGKPVPGVQVVLTRHFANGGMQYVAQPVRTDRDGRFHVDGDGRADASPMRLSFSHPDFLYRRVEGVQRMTSEQAGNLHVHLDEGLLLAGRAVDPAGVPIAGVMVEAEVAPDAKVTDSYDFRRAVNTAGDGRFELKGLPDNTPLVIHFLKTDAGWPILAGQVSTGPTPATRPALDVTLRPVELAPGKVVHELFGMKLVEIDDDLRARLFLYPNERLLITDPGLAFKRLAIGTPHTGDAFWMVNETRFKTFDDFVKGMLATCEAQHKAGRATFSVRVVYNFRRTNSSGSNTQYMTLDENDLAELRKAVAP